jgi:hypothetical protein
VKQVAKFLASCGARTSRPAQESLQWSVLPRANNCGQLVRQEDGKRPAARQRLINSFLQSTGVRKKRSEASL